MDRNEIKAEFGKLWRRINALGLAQTLKDTDFSSLESKIALFLVGRYSQFFNEPLLAWQSAETLLDNLQSVEKSEQIIFFHSTER